jgi:hypothetical protein
VERQWSDSGATVERQWSDSGATIPTVVMALWGGNDFEARVANKHPIQVRKQTRALISEHEVNISAIGTTTRIYHVISDLCNVDSHFCVMAE